MTALRRAVRWLRQSRAELKRGNRGAALRLYGMAQFCLGLSDPCADARRAARVVGAVLAVERDLCGAVEVRP